MPWLNPRFYLALAACIAVAAFCAFLYHAGSRDGSAKVQAKWDVERAAVAVLAKEAERENRNIETARLRGVLEAQAAATQRNLIIETSARRATAVADGLSKDLAAQRLQLPGLTRQAVDAYAKTANIVFEQCVNRYRAVAADADAAFSHIETLNSSWPTK